jgi:hypothetical protein
MVNCSIASTAAGFWIAFACFGIVEAQDRAAHLKFFRWVPPSHPVHASAQDWLASIENDSKGTITSAMYPAQQPGKAFEHYNMARRDCRYHVHESRLRAGSISGRRCCRNSLHFRRGQGMPRVGRVRSMPGIANMPSVR